VFINPELFLIVFLLDVWLLGYHHVISTFTKLAGTPEDRAENKFLIYQLPFLVLGGTAALFFAFGIWAIVTVYFFWQWYHYTRQGYGIAVFYRKKSGIKASATPQNLEHAAIWAIPIWGIMHRCSQQWDQFLFLPFWTPAIPFEISALAGAVAVLVVAFWLITKFVDFARGQLAYGSFFFMLSHQIIFLTGYILMPDINIGWLVANIWHNTQYILFVWLFNKNRFDQDNPRAPKKSKARIMPWISQPHPYRVMAYFAVCLLLTSIFYGTLSSSIKLISAGDVAIMTGAMVVIYQTINFHHYIVDSLIWKARKKSNQQVMKINND
jgi:hypothetical protein